MKSKFKKLFLTLLAMMLFAILSTNVYAKDDYVGEGVYESNVQYEEVNLKSPRIANIIKVSAVKRSDSKVRINCLNIGVDTFDKVTCKVKITNKSGLVQYHKTLTFTGISPAFSQYYDISVANWATVEVTNINCVDGTDKGTLPSFTLTN